MDHEPLPRRQPSPALRWVVTLLLLVAGGAGLVPVVDGDELGRISMAAVVDRHERVVRRRARPRRRPPVPRPWPRLLTAITSRIRPLLAVDPARRGPRRTPCVVALT